MHPNKKWAEMTTLEISQSDTSNWIAVLPIAAVEQHGPHLPLLTDAAIGQGNIEAILPHIPADLPLTFLPLLPFGKSDEHIGFKGTLTLSASTMIAILNEIGESLARSGIRKLILANSHGGNVSVMDSAARDLRIKHKMLVVQLSWHRLGYPEELFSESEQKFGIHGGQIETAQMLHFQEKLVRKEKLKNFISKGETMAQHNAHLRSGSPIPFAWQTEDLNAEGALGNASLATKQQGQALTDLTVQNFISLARDVQGFDMNGFDISKF
jgi:creatinine amidohydrolase